MPTESAYTAAQNEAALLRAWKTLKIEKRLSGNQAAAALGRSPSWFSQKYPRFARGGIAALMPERRELGATRHLFTDLPPWFLPVARFYYLTSNLTSTRGSVPEAIRCTISLPSCPPAVQSRVAKVCADAGWQPGNGEKLPSCPDDLRDNILARAKAGKPMLPESITRQISIAAPFVKQHRNSKDAGLDYVSAHGTQMLLRNPDTGVESFIRSGDIVEPDDSTANFPCVVDWPMRGCPCSERYGVKVARFQWLVSIDAGSRRVLGFSYTARAKSQYRSEDVLSLMRCVCHQHDIPRAWRMEKGIWASKRVVDAVKLMGSGRLCVHSPHAKPFIEGLFNKLWTKLAVWFPDASVGRFQGDGEQASKLLTACQLGYQDPRLCFPPLADVIAAFHAAIADHNASTITSANYGRWVPDERWTADIAARPLSRLNGESEWLFSPFMRAWKVRGNTAGGRVPLFPAVSVPYHFQAPFLLKFHGAEVRAYFDPADSHCVATLVLAQAWHNHRAGEIIGTAPQINRTTDYIRQAMGWSKERSDGIAQLRAAHTALRREVRGIIGTRETIAAVTESEERQGNGDLTRIIQGTESTPAAAPDEEVPTVAPSPISFTSRNGKVARLPLAIREELNTRLRNGEIGKKLVAWLNGLPEVQGVMAAEFAAAPVTENNLSHWKKGGFLEWLRQANDCRSADALQQLQRMQIPLEKPANDGHSAHALQELQRMQISSDKPLNNGHSAYALQPWQVIQKAVVLKSGEKLTALRRSCV